MFPKVLISFVIMVSNVSQDLWYVMLIFDLNWQVRMCCDDPLRFCDIILDWEFGVVKHFFEMATDCSSLTLQATVPKDYPEILFLLTGPFTDQEPLNKSLLDQGKCTRERSDQAKVYHATSAISSEYSVTAKHDGKTVGVTISTLITKEKYETPSSSYIPEIAALLSHLYNHRFENLAFDEFVLIHICIVHPSFQRCGLGQRMLEWTIEKAKIIGVPGLLAEATGIYSQRNFAKNGFKCIGEVAYHDYKDEKGNLVFPELEPHKSIQLMVMNVWTGCMRLTLVQIFLFHSLFLCGYIPVSVLRYYFSHHNLPVFKTSRFENAKTFMVIQVNRNCSTNFSFDSHQILVSIVKQKSDSNFACEESTFTTFQ